MHDCSPGFYGFVFRCWKVPSVRSRRCKNEPLCRLLLCQIPDSFCQVDGVIGAALQIDAEVCEEDTALGITGFLGHAVDVSRFDLFFGLVNKIFHSFRVIKAVEELLLENDQGDVHRLHGDIGKCAEVIQRFLVPTFITYVCIEVFSGALRGAGESFVPMVMTLLGVCVLRVLWVKLIAPLRGDSILFMLACYPISWTLTSILFVVYYLAGTWIKRCRERMGI